MTKPLTLSLLLIVILGSIGGYIYLVKANKAPCPPFPLPIICEKPSFSQSYIPVTKEPVSFNLEITQPEDQTLTTQNTLVVSGNTSPEATIIVTNDLNEQSTGFQSDKKGEFSKVINLGVGLNNITILVFNNQGDQKVETRSIYMSEEKI